MKLTGTTEKQHKEELLVLITVSLIAFMIIGALLIVDMYPFSTVDIRKLSDPEVQIISEKNGTVFGGENGIPFMKQYTLTDEKDTLTIKNDGKKSADITLAFSSSIVASLPEGAEAHDSLKIAAGRITVTLSPEESVDVVISPRFEKEEFIPHVTVKQEEYTRDYVTDGKTFKNAVTSPEGANEIIFMTDISLDDEEEDIIIPKNCAILLSEYSLSLPTRLILDCGEKGTFQMTGKEGSVTASGFIANAPNSAVMIDEPFFDISDDTLPYYITAKRFNSKRLRPEEFPVYTIDELITLVSDDAYPKLFDSAEIIFNAPITLTDSIRIEHAVTLKFNETFTTGSSTVSVISNASAALWIRDNTDGVDHTAFIYDTPNCSLSWSGKTAPGPLYVAERMNLLNYGGTDLKTQYGIGGYCMGTIDLFEIKERDNPVFEEDIVFEVQGNTLLGYISSYTVTEEDLKECDIAFKVTDCDLTFPAYMKNDNGTVDLSYDPKCIITDTYGNSKIFKIKLKRTGKSIPVVNIETDGGTDVLAKEDYQNAVISIDAIGRYGFEDVYDTEVTIRGRGNSTWKNYDKKPYRIHFPTDVSIFDLPAGKDWVLLANYTDKSLMRNRIANEIAHMLDNLPYAATQYCVDVFVNGEYMGVYTFGENLDVSETRIPLIDTGRADTGFLIEIGGVDNGVHIRNVDFFHAGLIKFALVKHPDELTRTASQVTFIKNYFKQADSAVKKMEGYEKYIDVDSVIDWLILHELSNNTDSSFRRSCYFIKQPGEILQMGPAWDFDIAFGNFIEDDPDYDTWACYTYHSPEETNVDTSKDYVGTTWGKYLLSDRDFVERFQKRWLEVKDDIVSSAIAEIDLTAEDIEESAKENFRVWRILNMRVTLQRKDVTKYNTFDKQVKYLKDFILTRSQWMTEELERMMAEFDGVTLPEKTESHISPAMV